MNNQTPYLQRSRPDATPIREKLKILRDDYKLDVFTNDGEYEKDRIPTPIVYERNYQGEEKKEFVIYYDSYNGRQVVTKRRVMWQFSFDRAIDLLKRVDPSFINVQLHFIKPDRSYQHQKNTNQDENVISNS
jgi:hypothetical protein